MLRKPTTSIVWPAGALLIAVPVSLPILMLLWAALGPGGESWAHMRDTVFPTYLANTVQLMLFVAVLSTVIGVLTAWLTVHYDFPLRRMLVPALALPLAAPAYVIG